MKNKTDNTHTLICIGREYGSGGHAVAKALSEKLGINMYDNELITKAAEKSGFSKDLFLRTDEKRSLFSLSSFFSINRHSPGDNYINDNQLFKIQSNVIRDIADNESAVFVGRCSDYILRDRNCLSVFITAPSECRIKRLCDKTGIKPEDAANEMTRENNTRETYYNYFTFGEWGAAENYDLCIDSSLLGIDETADLIIEFGKRAGKIKENNE